MCDLVLEFAVFYKQSFQLWAHCAVCQCTTAILNLHYACLQTLDLGFLAMNSDNITNACNYRKNVTLLLL